MAINQLTTGNTFGQWITTTQALVALANTLTDGKGATFTANTILEISGSGSYLNVANVAKVATLLFYDGTTLTSNASLTGAFSKANTANVTAEAAFSKANTANVTAEAAFSKANTANVTGEAAFSKANTANVTAEAAFSKANTANVTAQAAFDKANTDATNISISTGTYGNSSIVAVVTVTANGRVSSISNATINLTQISTGTLSTNRLPTTISTVNSYTNVKTINYSSNTLTYGANVAWNMNDGVVAELTLSGATTSNISAPTNIPVGTALLQIKQDGTGGRTVNWNSVFKWPSGVAPVLSTAPFSVDVFSFFCDGTNLYGSYIRDVK